MKAGFLERRGDVADGANASDDGDDCDARKQYPTPIPPGLDRMWTLLAPE
eukprot:CAMPEP_0167799118 /NCGR_PEP_ID=MMETSP0111_2-20121227/16779_1 /TAXON_ID=91324 /ORGANISM="Lotharella globosa, Strain CCCM811" /LENGTH=49 /DNA_ID= /DNA_START= /DNA_END= /DNA_ORIENTATION=